MEDHISWILHEGKEHGLNDILDSLLEASPTLVVSPDGGTNDKEAQVELNTQGIKVLVADHHLANGDYSNDLTDIVNVQLTDYPNKALTGAGVVWQFCRWYDRHISKTNFADDFVDLAALGDISDMSLFTELEIRALVTLGLSKFKNPLLHELYQENKYIVDKHHGGYLGVAFGMVPFINAVTRSGTMEEKNLVFEAMLSHVAFDRIESSKRGEKSVQVPLYKEAVTVLKRVKRRQADLQDAAMTEIDRIIQEKNLRENAVIAVVLDPSQCEASLCGLCANKIQAKYQHPAMVLRKIKEPQDEDYHYKGSLRNYSLSPIENFASLCRDTGLTDFVAGQF